MIGAFLVIASCFDHTDVFFFATDFASVCFEFFAAIIFDGVVFATIVLVCLSDGCILACIVFATFFFDARLGILIDHRASLLFGALWLRTGLSVFA